MVTKRFNFGNTKKVKPTNYLPENEANIAKSIIFNTTSFDINTSYIISESNEDYLAMVDTIHRYFLSIFKYDLKYRHFTRKMEKILFEFGKVAIYKTPKGDIYPFNFEYDLINTDQLDQPTKIRLITSKISDIYGKNKTTDYIDKWDNVVLDIAKDNVVIGYNNGTHKPTILYGLNMMRQSITALNYVYDSNKIGQPSVWFIGQQDDTAMEEIEEQLRNNNIVKRVTSDMISSKNVFPNQWADMSGAKWQTYQNLLANFLKWLGLSHDSAIDKKAKVSEMQLAKGDTFGTGIIADMFTERMLMLSELKEKLGFELSLEEMEEDDNSLRDTRENKGGMTNLNKEKQVEEDV